MLKGLLLPPGGIIVAAGLLFLLLRRRPRARGAILPLTLALLYLLSIPFVSHRLLGALDWYPALVPAGQGAGLPAAEAIVVLSAGRRRDAPMYGGDTVDGLSLERLRFAARLHHATGLPVLATGGPANDPKWPRPMSALMAESLARDFGVATVWTEGRSLNTAENATLSAIELERRAIRRVFLVTHGWHMPRAVQSFRQTGIAVIPAPATEEGRPGLEFGDFMPSARAFDETAYALHEWIGLLWYRLRYPPR